jgi:PTH1 family peptidyl-tRNA hydrolase
MRVVVGLGNPGTKYVGTRHNIGFMVIDYLAEGPRAGRFQARFHGQVAELIEDGEKLLLVKPETFMNLSGRCVREVLDYYQVPVADLLVVCDDINLALGKLRVRARGSDGGQKGLRDVQNHLGTDEYARLRIGIDTPGEAGAVDYVLSRFRPSEKPVIEEAVRTAGEAVMYWGRHGVEATMNRYNAGPERPKKAKPAE